VIQFFSKDNILIIIDEELESVYAKKTWYGSYRLCLDTQNSSYTFFYREVESIRQAIDMIRESVI
jgi:hypothetical protein